MATPIRKLGGAVRISVEERKKAENEDSSFLNDEEESLLTPKASNIQTFEFNAPKFHDFTQEESEQNDKWFGNPKTHVEEHEESPEVVPEVKRKSRLSIRKSIEKSAKVEREFHKMILRKRKSTGKVAVIQINKKKSAPKSSLTVPKPFRVANKGKSIPETAGDQSPFVPLAVRVKKFEEDTPERFKVKPKPFKRVYQQSKLTLPQSPMLTTKLRSKLSKSSNLKSSEEILEEKMKNIVPFKAKPVNKRILQIKEEIVLGEPKITVPMSPAITKPQPKVIPPVEIPKVKANPVPDLSKPFVPEIEHRKIHVPEFHLPGDEIHEKKRKEIEEFEKSQTLELEKQRKFRANPIQLPEKPFEPKHEHKITEPVPFDLKTEQRGQVYQKEFEEKVLKESIVPEFHAQPLPDLKPFVPKRVEKPQIEVKEIVLHSDQRAEERKVFEQELKERQLEEERLRNQQEEIQKENERREINRLRKEIVHKANPVRKFKNVEIKPSEKKLTEPKTPRFVRTRKVKEQK